MVRGKHYPSPLLPLYLAANKKNYMYRGDLVFALVLCEVDLCGSQRIMTLMALIYRCQSAFMWHRKRCLRRPIYPRTEARRLPFTNVTSRASCVSSSDAKCGSTNPHTPLSQLQLRVLRQIPTVPSLLIYGRRSRGRSVTHDQCNHPAVTLTNLRQALLFSLSGPTCGRTGFQISVMLQ